MRTFDAIIIGSGQAGTPLVFKLAANGKKVAFIEKEHFGGTCLNVGCTPTKTYVASARRIYETQHGDDLGIEIPNGAKARIPKEYDGVDVLTNNEILQLEEIPEHLIIIGGSYIGLEFGQMFRRFGSEVTIIEKQGTLINREDKEVSKTIKEILENEGVNFRMNATCLSATQTSGGKVIVKIDCTLGPPEIIGSHLLLAVGRTPNTDTLNLESTGVEVDERGFIKVNDNLETNVSGIFALGDCNGKGAFTHTAYNDYEIIAENMFDGKDRKISDRIATYGLFIDPPLGRAGLTLAQAKETGKKLKVGYRRMSNVARARERGETNGFMSVVIDADTDRILGASILGIGGDEIISSLLNIMYADQPYTVIRDSVQPHPTVSELIPTMLEGVREI